MSENLIILRARSDNLMYLYEYEIGKAFLVDSADEKVAFDALEKHNLTLTHVLLTHHHADHTTGTFKLQQKTGCKIAAPNEERIYPLDIPLKDGDELDLGDVKVKAITTPGHTRTSMCFYLQPYLFTGDTLFTCGCGRVFECSYETMVESLRKIATLPDDTIVCPGHDYEKENFSFAIENEPKDSPLIPTLEDLRANKKNATSKIATEKGTNPFLRCILEAADESSAISTFTKLREAKDLY